MSCLLNKIVAIDFLTSPPNLKVNQQNAYKTFAGGILTIIIYVLTAIGIGYFGQELFFKTEPFVVASDKDFDEVGPFEVKVDSFYFYTAVQDKDYFFYEDPTIFEIKANHQLWWYENGVQKSVFTEVEISLCNNYFNNTSELNIKRDLIDLDKFFCVKPNTYSIEGFWGGEKFGFITIELTKCSNSTENNNHCKPKEIIDMAIEGGQFDIVVDTYNLQYNNYDTPVVKNYKDIFYSINNEFTINMFVQLQSLQFENDGGFLLQDIKTTSSYYIDEPHVLYYGNRGNLLARVGVKCISLGKHIKRSYTKFQDILTKIGGLIKAFTVIGSFIAKTFSNIQFYNDYLFNLSIRDDEIQKNRPSNKMNKLEDIKINQDKSNIILDKCKIEGQNQIIIHNLSNHGHITINKSMELYSLKNQAKDFILQILICKKSEIRTRKKILSSKINHVLSIDSILEKFFMIEVLQNHLLSENEITLSNRLFYDIMTNKESSISNYINLYNSNNKSIFKLNKDKLEKYYKDS